MSPDPSSIMLAATHPLQCTGYARVGASIANGLAERGHTVTYWGYQNLAPSSGRFVHGNVNVVDVGAIVRDGYSFGIDQFPKAVSVVDPDILLLYNDVMVLNQFLDALDGQFPTSADGTRHPSKPSKVVCYVDLVHDDQDHRLVDGIVRRADEVWVFAAHWRDHLLKTYPDNATRIHVVPHGMDPSLIEYGEKLTKTEARNQLNIPEGAFVIVNMNRNSYRKALDISIDSFLRFWKDHRDAVLVLNNNAGTDSGYDIEPVILSICRRLGLEDDVATIFETAILRFQNGGFMPDSAIAALHVACDLGLNTCLGEGFGLCQLEGACLGRPQIATKTGGLINILETDTAHQLIEPRIHLTLPRGFVIHSGTMDIPDPVDVTNAIQVVYDTRPTVDVTSIRERYNLTSIIDNTSSVLTLKL